MHIRGVQGCTVVRSHEKLQHMSVVYIFDGIIGNSTVVCFQRLEDNKQRKREE